MSNHPVPHDVAVVGLGAMGSAAAWSLARAGQRVVGFDRYTPPHTLGSSHGRTRIIREAYFEHPLYVPLVSRAFERWGQLERRSGRTLLRPTGGLMIGPPDGVLVTGSRASVLEHRLPHETLTAEEIRQRYAGFRPPDGMCGILEHRAGLLFAERCHEALLEAAAGEGAQLRTGERVEDWWTDADGVTLRTSRAAEVRVRHVVLAAGPWLPALLGRRTLPLEVERQLFHSFAPAEGGAAFERVPVAIWEYAPGRFFYTFPDIGDGVKIGIHHEGRPVDPESIDRTARAEEEARARALLARFLPDANGALREAAVCMYTNTPDGHFVVDRHPASQRVIVVSACSGHGFKFSPAVGDLVADLVLRRGNPFDLTPFRIHRPALH